jgi:hypothetical protein
MLDMPLHSMDNTSMRSTADATCTNCNTLYENLPLDGDEDGRCYVALEVTPCAICTAMLCRCCTAFACDACGDTFCVDHLVSVPDGTDRPLHLCTDCDAESKPLCPACGEHADMRPMETSTERWYECACCNARMDEAEIDAAQPSEPAPTCMECYELMLNAATVGDMIKLIKAHRIAGCPHCAPKLPDPLPAQSATLPAVAHAA